MSFDITEPKRAFCPWTNVCDDCELPGLQGIHLHSDKGIYVAGVIRLWLGGSRKPLCSGRREHKGCERDPGKPAADTHPVAGSRHQAEEECVLPEKVEET